MKLRSKEYPYLITYTAKGERVDFGLEEPHMAEVSAKVGEELRKREDVEEVKEG